MGNPNASAAVARQHGVAGHTGWAIANVHTEQLSHADQVEEAACVGHSSGGQGQEHPAMSRSGSLPTSNECLEGKNPAKRMSVKEQLAARFGRTKSASEIAAEKSMELIARLKSGLADVDKKQQQTLSSCQSLLDACGDAIAAWFKGLSGKALQRAIKEVRSRQIPS